jgi:hypothetical protein
MRPKPPPEFVGAHEIGRTHDILGCIPIVHLVCRCTSGGTPLLLAGCPSEAACPSCNRVFVLTAVTCKGVMVGTHIDVREAYQGLEGTVQ